MTGDQCAGKKLAAARGSKVDDPRRWLTGVPIVGEPPRQGDGRVDLAKTGVENRHAALLEQTLALKIQCHDNQTRWQRFMHAVPIFQT